MTIGQSRAVSSAETEQAFYAWLSAENKAAADSHFGVFYQGFSRTLQASIRKRYRGISQELVDDAVAEAMLKMLELFGEPRRKAIGKIAAVLPSLQPLALGGMHCRRVRVWKAHVTQYRLDVLGFAPDKSVSGSMRRDLIEAFNLGRRKLVEGGQGLIDEVRTHSGGEAVDLGDLQNTVAQFIATLRDLVAAMEASGVDRKLGLEGASGFVLSIDELLMALRQLRVLTRAYAFTVCINEVKSHFRSGRRRSNASKADDAPGNTHIDNPGGGANGGGIGVTQSDPSDAPDRRLGSSAPPEEAHNDDSGGGAKQLETSVGGNISDDFPMPAGDQDGQDSGGVRVTLVDPSNALDQGIGSSAPPNNAEACLDTDDIGDSSPGPEETALGQELYRHLLSALEEPIRAARQRLAEAETKRDRDRAQSQVDGAIEEHELDLELLFGWDAGEAQEKMAARLGITREQVRHRLKRMAQRIIEYCEARNISYSEHLPAMAEGRTRPVAREVSTNTLRPSLNVIDGGRSSTGGEP